MNQSTLSCCFCLLSGLAALLPSPLTEGTVYAAGLPAIGPGWAIALFGLGLLSMLIGPGVAPVSDRELVRRFQQSGNQLLLCQLIQRHRALLHHNLRRFGVDMTPEDFEQEMYLLLYDKLPKAGEVMNVRAWLSTIVRNRLRDLLRKEGSRQQYQHHCQGMPQSYDTRIDHLMDRQHLIALAFEAVNDKEAQCLKARYLGERSYEEVADTLGLSVKQVCGRLERGMKKMRQRVGPL